MDACLLLAPMDNLLGLDGPGDFFLAEDGRLTHRGAAPSAPYAYIGVQILKPQTVDDGPEGPFSLFAELDDGWPSQGARSSASSWTASGCTWAIRRR